MVKLGKPAYGRSLSEHTDTLNLYDELYFSHIRQGAKHLSVPHDVFSTLNTLSVCAKGLQLKQIEEMLPLAETSATYHWDLRGQLPIKNHLPFFVWSAQDADSREIYLREGDKELGITLEVIDTSAILEIYNLKKSSLEMHFEKGIFSEGVQVEHHRTSNPETITHASELASFIEPLDRLLIYFSHSNLSERFKGSCKGFLDTLATFPQREINEIFPQQSSYDKEGFLRSVLFATRMR